MWNSVCMCVCEKQAIYLRLFAFAAARVQSGVRKRLNFRVSSIRKKRANKQANKHVYTKEIH